MSEDKMREEFEAYYSNRAPFEINGVGLYCDQSTQALWSGWKACAAIKDAEIAELKKIPMKYKRMEFNAQLHQEIAARDLMIKGLREDLLAIAQSAYMPPALVGIIKQRLAKSEHHNSRAQEIKLLEAELAILRNFDQCEHKPTWNVVCDMIAEREAKLAELNKE